MKNSLDAIAVKKYLTHFNIDKAFTYRDTQHNPGSKASRTIRLNHIKNVDYACEHC